MEETDTQLAVEYRLQQQPHAEAIQNYVNDPSGSRLQGLLASNSTISRPHTNESQAYRGQQARSYATSMLPSGNSEASKHSSLPALTVATSCTTSSVASSMGRRALEVQQRILEQDQGGVLVVPPLPGQRILECPFNLAFLCPLTFSNEEDWINHSLVHFSKERRVIDPPTSNSCCFCDEQFHSPARFQSWVERMRHVSLHHCLGHRLGHARPDFALFKYLFDNRLISDADYRDLKGNTRNRSQRAAAASYPTPPTSPDSPVAQMAPVPVYTETEYSGRRGARNRRR
ncbi:MAG: hypothetical protein Q9195_000599 [Heterodermia aff. obscurata]